MVTPSWVVRERVACPFTAQMPRNSATELSTTSFFLIILAGKGDIPEVVDQLKPLEDLHFHLNHENGMAEDDLKDEVEYLMPLEVENTTKLCPGPTMQSRPCRPWAGFGLVVSN